MDRYNVECIRNNETVSDNFVGDYIEAESESQAIKLATLCMLETAVNNHQSGDFHIWIDDGELWVRYVDDDGVERMEHYHSFTATPLPYV